MSFCERRCSLEKTQVTHLQTCSQNPLSAVVDHICNKLGSYDIDALAWGGCKGVLVIVIREIYTANK